MVIDWYSVKKHQIQLLVKTYNIPDLYPSKVSIQLADFLQPHQRSFPQ